MCARDSVVRELFEAADLIHADGTPLVFASRLRNVRLPERVATTDLFHDVAERAPSVAATFYLLGATDAGHRACRRECAAEIPAPDPRGIPQRLFLRRRGERGRGAGQRRQAGYSVGRHGRAGGAAFLPARSRQAFQCRADQDLRRAVRFRLGPEQPCAGLDAGDGAGMGVPHGARAAPACLSVPDDESARRLSAADLAQPADEARSCRPAARHRACAAPRLARARKPPATVRSLPRRPFRRSVLRRSHVASICRAGSTAAQRAVPTWERSRRCIGAASRISACR